MIRTIRAFLLFESFCFAAAAAIHFGIVPSGYGHLKAGIAETVIAAVLAAGLAWTWSSPGGARRAGIAAQGFAFLGTCVGLFTIAIGVGPGTAPDIAYHILVLAVLFAGLRYAGRGLSGPGSIPRDRKPIRA